MSTDALLDNVKILIRHNGLKENLLKLKISKLKSQREELQREAARLRKYSGLYRNWQHRFKSYIYSLVANKKIRRAGGERLLNARKERVEKLEAQVTKLKQQMMDIDQELKILNEQLKACSRKKNKFMILADGFVDMVAEIA